MRVLAILLLAVACGAAFAHKDHRAERGWERVEVNEPAPAFTLVNQQAKRVALRDLRGRPLVLTFLFTSCTDVCPALIHVPRR